MKLTRETQNKIASGIIFFSFGVSVGIVLDNLIIPGGLNYNRDVQFEFDIVGVLTLAVTVLIAIILERNFSSKDKAKDAEKNTLTKNLEGIDADFTQKVKDLTRGGAELQYVTQVLKRHRMRAYKLIELAKRHNLINQDSASAKNLLETVKRIQDLMTNTPRNQDDIEDGVRLQDGNLYFSEQRKSDIVSALFDFNSTVFELITEVHSK